MEIGKHLYPKLVFLVVLLLLVSCSIQPRSPAAIETSHVSPSFTTTAQTAVTLTPTAIGTAVTVTLPLMPSLTPVAEQPSQIIVNEQLEELERLPAGVQVPGTFVLVSPVGGPYQIYLWNIETGLQRTLLPDGSSAERFAVSSDRRWLAYDEGLGQPGDNEVDDLENRPPYWQDRFLVVTDASGQKNIRIAYQQGWGPLSRWITDEQLIIRSAKSDDGFPNFTERWVLDPFTSKLLELAPEPIDIFSDLPGTDWHGMGMVSYDPDLTRRAYLGNRLTLVLESLPSQEVLADFDTVLDSPAEWSPDGQQFFMVGRVESDSDGDGFALFIVDRDGQITQTIDFAHIYDNYAWSPDGQKIALWTTPPDTTFLLKPAVLDLSTGVITVYSLESSPRGSPKLIWSPDGDQLLVGVTSFTDVTTERAVLIDLDEKWVVPVAEDLLPEGWLVNSP